MDTVDWRFIIMSQDACEAARLGLDAERSSRLRAFFDHYDIDQNHALDTNELECMLLELGHEADHTIARALQDEFGDVSHGGISFSAFLRLVAKHEGNNAALTGGEPTSLNNPITFFRRFSLSVAHAAGLTKGEDECALWFCGLRSWSPIAPGERSSPPSSSLPPSTSEDLSLSLPPVCTLHHLRTAAEPATAAEDVGIEEGTSISHSCSNGVFNYIVRMLKKSRVCTNSQARVATTNSAI